MIIGQRPDFSFADGESKKRLEKPMRKISLLVLCLSLSSTVVLGQEPRQNQHYLFNGRTVEAMDDRHHSMAYARWQIWLYQSGVHVPRYSVGLQYSRWGLLEGSSAEEVTELLKNGQRFEVAYTEFFGSGTWGRYTFLNPVGPIAVNDPSLSLEEQSATDEKRYQLRGLEHRANSLAGAVRPSLENHRGERPASPVKDYFDLIKDVQLRVSRVSGQLSREHPQLGFIERGLAQAKAELAQAEVNARKITSVLPSVKLPTSGAWMSHAEWAGSDGTIRVEVMETGSGVLVQQSWTGGDGGMAGTVILTTIPYADIGELDISQPSSNGHNQWTIRVESATVPFPETLESPVRKTAKATYRAVHWATTESWVYLVFSEAAKAQDAYSYLLYHKQLGR